MPPLARLDHLQTFDNASRGPLGAFKFFWRSPSRSPLPWVGCIVTLLAIAIDPFTQQILRFDTRLTEVFDVAPASITASQVYDLGNAGAPNSHFVFGLWSVSISQIPGSANRSL